jgi:hypothetical protein
MFSQKYALLYTSLFLGKVKIPSIPTQPYASISSLFILLLFLEKNKKNKDKSSIFIEI